MQTSETQVPVPWGHIAVKVWGDERNPPVLVVHGMMDNAGAMDSLLRLLPSTFCYYAMDLPGHGRSSQWPPNSFIHSIDQLLAFKAVTTHFKHQQYAILGHSWGGQLALFFTLVYPELVTRLIMIDAIFFHLQPAKYFRSDVRDAHNQYFATMKKLSESSSPEYSHQEALDRIMRQRIYAEIPTVPAENILRRIAMPTTSGKVRLATDQRLKFMLMQFCDYRYAVDLLTEQPITCPVLILLATDSYFQTMYHAPILEAFHNLPNFDIRHVVGHHDLHMEQPESIAPSIATFLQGHLNAKL